MDRGPSLRGHPPGGQAGSGSRGAAAPLITCLLWSRLGVFTPPAACTPEPKKEPAPHPALGEPSQPGCLHRWGWGGGRLPFMPTPVSLTLRLLPRLGCSARCRAHSSVFTAACPRRAGCSLPPGTAPPAPTSARTPKASRQQLAPEKGGERRNTCSVPEPLPEAVFILAAPRAGVPLQVALSRVRSSWLMDHALAGRACRVAAPLSLARPGLLCGPGKAEGPASPCVVACTCNDHGVSLAQAVLTVPCDRDLGKFQLSMLSSSAFT